MSPVTPQSGVPRAPGEERRRVPRDESGTGEELLGPIEHVDAPDGAPAQPHVAPRVVLFRPAGVAADTRAKKIALSLSRAGYEVVLMCGGTPLQGRIEEWLGPVRVLTIPVPTSARDLRNMRLVARRRRAWRLIDWTSRDEYVTRAAELRGAVNNALDRRRADPSSQPARVMHVLARAHFIVRRLRWRAQGLLDKVIRGVWRRWDAHRARWTALATDAGTMPEILDYVTAFSPVLDELQPDVIHAHHPTVLPLAVRAARRARGWRRSCVVVYDARENFAGIPEGEQGTRRRHHVLVRCEVRGIAGAAGVLTVSEPIADVLQQRYRLAERPTVLLNAPPRAMAPSTPAAAAAATTSAPGLRELAGLAADVPLLVYSGGISHARGIEVLIEALPLLPGVHLALVPVPFPHNSVPVLQERAAELGAADRLHVLPPVGQDRLIDYLAGADVALHPLPGGSPNHDQAMPNKLFEYLHAGLPLVVSDARLMAEFVRGHGVGEVFRTDDAADLARAVRAVLDAPGARPDRDALARRFCWQQQEEPLLALYQRLCPVPEAIRPKQRDDDFPDLAVTTQSPSVLPPMQAPRHEVPA